jgi:hypothetical protein
MVMGKLVPITKGKNVRSKKFYEGALPMANAKYYQKIIEKSQDIINNIDF